MESIKYFLYLLDVDPFWIIIILILLIIRGFYPYNLRGKSINTEDKDGNKLGNGTQLSVTYGKDGMEDVTFSAEVGMDGELTPAEVRTCEDGTELCFYKLTNKFVPADYELTEEDKKAQEDGNFNLAYGSDKVEVMTSYTVEWNMDGQGYSLFKFGEDLGAEEMFGMAEEIIAGQSK